MIIKDISDKSLPAGPEKPDEYTPAQPYEEYFSEGGLYRHLGKGSRLREKMNEEERKRAGYNQG